MSAVFVLENGFYTDTGALKGVLFNRQAYVGVSSEHGVKTFGRQYSPHYKAWRNVADPFSAGLEGKVGNVMATDARVDNLIEYVSPKIAGFFADLSMGLGEQAGDRRIGAG
jgi:predicted porin